MVASEPGFTLTGKSGVSITRTPGVTCKPPAPPTQRITLGMDPDERLESELRGLSPSSLGKRAQTR